MDTWTSSSQHTLYLRELSLSRLKEVKGESESPIAVLWQSTEGC